MTHRDLVPALLVDLPPPLLDTTVGWCKEHELRPVALAGSSLQETWTHPPLLCVAHAEKIERDLAHHLESWLERTFPAPWVVISREMRPEDRARLHYMGVEGILDSNARAVDLIHTLTRVHSESYRDTLNRYLDGHSPAIENLRSQILRVAGMSSGVLIEGETGTGKGVAARMIHSSSARLGAPFVHVDCAALPPGLIETELFGHERGAFTGAVGRRTGRFELAEMGTIFLDEIGDLDRPLQSRLMRVLEDRAFERVGGTETVSMQARVIAATSRNLPDAVQRGEFREDLYYRLSGLRLRIPPLRERIEDLPLLVRMGARRIVRRNAEPPPRIPAWLLERFERHPWRGNVRELLNTIERLLVLPPEDVLDPDPAGGCGVRDQAPRFDGPRAALDPEAHAAREEIRAVLKETGGNVARAARRLGISRSTLRYRILRYGLSHLIPMD